MLAKNQLLSEIPGVADKGLLEERQLVGRMREAVSFCKKANNIPFRFDQMDGMGPQHRLVMEECLVKNYLLTKGMDYFGKRDLIYIDMRGQEDVEGLYTRDYAPPQEPEGGDDE